MADDKTTHFGFKTVPIAEKAKRVAGVFNSVASRYDIMNDVMSLGTHRVMKQMAVDATRARRGHTVLDIAGGTGDLAIHIADRVGRDGHVILADINQAMRVAADKLPGIVGVVEDPIVSSDVIGNSHSLLFDIKGTIKAGGYTIKTLSWYENLGHAARLLDVVRLYSNLDQQQEAA